MQSVNLREAHVPAVASDLEDGVSLMNSDAAGAKRTCAQLRGIGAAFVLGILFAGCVAWFQNPSHEEEVNYADLVSQVQNKWKMPFGLPDLKTQHVQWRQWQP